MYWIVINKDNQKTSMSTIKSTPPYLFTFIVLITISAIMVIPISGLLKDLGASEFQTEYAGLSLKMGLIFILSLFTINRLNLNTIAGLTKNHKWEFKYLNLIPVYLMLLGVLSIIGKDISQVQPINVLLLLLGCIAVGFGEEFLFRGLLQPVFLKRYITQPKGLFLGIFFPAFIFGLFHLLNLFTNDVVLSVLVQVVFATFIGFFFGVLALRTNKLIPLAITHGLINFFFSLQFLPGLQTEASSQNAGGIGPIFVFLPLFIIGLLVLKKLDKSKVMEKLQGM